ncbi:DUF1330 domain-containing protein [Mycobacterium yunnanensis]|uniref:DUF1330 domain-containing protein n=1 Tax=Mycobacterium yunnanensis TaxID=368477 RepID=A0A9X2Z0H5_9MYCO|nr:DUF1330 domain-containing protein [Mycobacterium yunnanensis]MCV7420716.1 DUF1330 domain-containing protein [Mycobacterium yunnanensis]
MTTHQTSSDTRFDGFWGSYALGILDDLRFGPQIVEYLERIEDTLHPFGGVFLIHGAPWQQVEGQPIGAPVLIAFPDPRGARQWYESEAYQAISSLRSENSDSHVLLVEGVGADHRSTDITGHLARGGR